MIPKTTGTLEDTASTVTPWLLVVSADEAKARSTRIMWEAAGFAVEVAANAEDARACLEVMTPALIMVDDRLYTPR